MPSLYSATIHQDPLIMGRRGGRLPRLTAGTHNVSGRPENIDIYPSLNDGAYQDPSLLHSSSLFG